MPNLVRAFTPDNPLMLPVQYNGHEYFCSQYFHQQYLSNSPHGGKYRRHDEFIRAVKSIEAYQEHLDTQAAVELRWLPRRQWTNADPALVQHFNDLEFLFTIIGYRTLYLFNATGQAMMSHKLDDALSKQMSVAINTTVARQVTRRTADLLPDEIATRKLSTRLDAGKLLGVALHIAQQEAVKAVYADTGIDYRPLLLSAPAQDNIPVAAKMLEPMDLAAEFGWGRTIPAAARMNKQLEAFGWQVRKIGGSGWDATPEGEQHCAAHAWSEKGHSGYNYKWRLADVKQAFSANRLDVQTPPHAQEEH